MPALAMQSSGSIPTPKGRSTAGYEKGASLWTHAWRRLRRNRAAVCSGMVLLLLFALCLVVPEVSSYRYDRADLATGPVSPCATHWMGTDFFGRDLMARVFFGGRISFAVAILAMTVSFVIGSIWGTVAGYFGGKIDAFMMRAVDILNAFPLIVLVILILVFFANDKTWLYSAWVFVVSVFSKNPKDPALFPIFQIVLVFVALGAISWLNMARIVRGQVIALRSQPFVEAARSIGVGHAGLIFRHLLPNAVGPMIVYATLTIPEIMMTEAFLSFLGLGTQEPLSSWGLLVSTGADAMTIFPWQLFFPSLMLAITLVCFNLFGDGVRDALDPRVRRVPA